MTLTEQRNRAPELLAQVDDEFFATFYAMLETYVRKHGEATIGYRAGEEITASALKTSIAKAEDQIDRGEFLTTDELEKDTEEWLSSIE